MWRVELSLTSGIPHVNRYEKACPFAELSVYLMSGDHKNEDPTLNGVLRDQVILKRN
jgi:hypothetical protein